MNTGNIVGIGLGIKLVNGKFKPKYGSKAIIGLVVVTCFLLGFSATLGYGIWKGNIGFIIPSILGIFGFGYLLLISPYTQNANHYSITFQNENSLAGFQLYYKGKLVNVLYKVGQDGRIAFTNNQKKTSCISYADGTKMSGFVKYKITNYFAKWLSDYHLLSDEVTVSLE